MGSATGLAHRVLAAAFLADQCTPLDFIVPGTHYSACLSWIGNPPAVAMERAMHARVTKMFLKDGAAAKLVEGAKAYMADTAGKPEGYIGALLLLSDDGAEATSVTLWTSDAVLAKAEAGNGYATVMKPYEPLFSRPYQRTAMRVGATSLVKPR